MNEHSGNTKSIWMETANVALLPPLKENQKADVCVVGAGIAGLTTAYLLSREGRSVVVVDDGPIAAGETERTSAHLSSALDDGYAYLEKKHGEEGARLNADSHQAAIDKIEQIVQEEAIDCDFTRVNGYLFLPPGMDATALEDEFAAARKAGVRGIALVDRAPLKLFDTGPAIRYPGLAQFHPLKYLNTLVQAIQRQGGRLFANTRVQTVEDGTPAKVVTESNLAIECQAVVVATNTPVNDRYKIHTKQAPYRTYVIGLRILPASVPIGLYWDMAQDSEAAKDGHLASYHYVRVQKDSQGEVLLVGGEDHKTAHGMHYTGDERWAALEEWSRRRFPDCKEVVYRWSGQVMEPVDGVAFIGRNPGETNVYIATGDSGHGMTHGTIAGMLITDLIQGRENAWARVYDPARKATRALGDFTRENLDVAVRYGEFLTAGDVGSIEEIALDSGAVMRQGLSKRAIYKDAQGTVHQFSAVCPHLKCIVHWNPTEKSWDCPCHGSRFTKLGEVINGPALSGLTPISQQEKRRAA